MLPRQGRGRVLHTQLSAEQEAGQPDAVGVKRLIARLRRQPFGKQPDDGRGAEEGLSAYRP